MDQLECRPRQQDIWQNRIRIGFSVNTRRVSWMTSNQIVSNSTSPAIDYPIITIDSHTFRPFLPHHYLVHTASIRKSCRLPHCYTVRPLLPRLCFAPSQHASLEGLKKSLIHRLPHSAFTSPPPPQAAQSAVLSPSTHSPCFLYSLQVG